jgi:hypothetical protein
VPAEGLQSCPPSAPRNWLKDPVGALKDWWGTAKLDRTALAALGMLTAVCIHDAPHLSSVPLTGRVGSSGASAVCSYGLVSNINYCGTMIASWLIYVKRHGVSPFSKANVGANESKRKPLRRVLTSWRCASDQGVPGHLCSAMGGHELPEAHPLLDLRGPHALLR